MSVMSVPASAITVNDTIDVTEPLGWVRRNADAPDDSITLAIDIAAFERATVTEIETAIHDDTGEAVVIIRNTIYDLAVPATLAITRIVD